MLEEALVLYAEDDENDAYFMERAFEELQRPDALRIVRDGAMAIEYLEGRGRFSDRVKYPRPTLVVLDVKMPRKSGLEVLSWLRANPNVATIPVVMFTSSTQEPDVSSSRTQGANAYIVKPTNAAHLSVMMKELLESSARMANPGSALSVSGNYMALPALKK